MTRPRKADSFAQFCKKNKIAKDSIRWVTLGDKRVRISISRNDFKDGSWNLLSVGIALAMRQLDVGVDVTIRENGNDIEVVVEK